ncbi:class I SAM-dependent methyltransferase [Polaribacter uvawellassae]|uniref:class I SAM-dependent methyltransferase n=1 Tax=Polaribacter uvawellassae TaxID=3133495 RepID=UPI00321A5477
MKNINTKKYWDKRFSTGDWETSKGRNQTADFAKSQVERFDIPKNFSGTILDFGCGLGDAIPIYKKKYPKAKLIGVDISEEAIKKCKKSFGDIATFIAGTENEVPTVDIIISSNVFEHLSNDKEIAKVLIQKCKTLYITVPFNENLKTSGATEHINSYDEDSFNNTFKNVSSKKFRSKGWGETTRDLIIKVYLKNIFRFLFGKKLRIKTKQIMFKIQK